MRLLLVEDDAMIGDSVRQGLRQDGFALDWVRDGAAAELALTNGVYDLMLLDLGLPKKDGLDVLRTLRRHIRACRSGLGDIMRRAPCEGPERWIAMREACPHILWCIT